VNEVIILCLWINNRIFAAIFLNDILMNYGYVKVAAAVPRVKVADCKFNAREIEKEIIIAEGKGVQIIAFPELCVTGYTCGDLFVQQLLLEEAEMGLIQIVSNTRQLDIIAILGMPIAMNGVLLNAAVVIQKGKVLGVVPKTYLPNYKEFYEKRWFTSAVDVSERSVRLCGQVVPMGTDSKLRIQRSALKSVRICGHLFRPVLHWHCKVRKFCLICRRIMKGLVSTTICVL
jgi:NAD+ synthase (glutamine-hydrolysing)